MKKIIKETNVIEGEIVNETKKSGKGKVIAIIAGVAALVVGGIFALVKKFGGKETDTIENEISENE